MTKIDMPKKHRTRHPVRHVVLSDEEKRAYEESARQRAERDAAEGKPRYAPFKSSENFLIANISDDSKRSEQQEVASAPAKPKRT